MVMLSRIYTRVGDGGQTRLGNGEVVSKFDPRVEAYGDVDELNSLVGVVLAQPLPETVRQVLVQAQHDLFDLGADLCQPGDATGGASGRVSSEGGATADRAPKQPQTGPRRLEAQHVQRLEAAIDDLNSGLAPLRSFALPGGCAAAAHLHVARAVCRRAERRAWLLAATAAVNEQALRYLNRLSDLLFVLARTCNTGGAGDVEWQPDRSRPSGG